MLETHDLWWKAVSAVENLAYVLKHNKKWTEISEKVTASTPYDCFWMQFVIFIAAISYEVKKNQVIHHSPYSTVKSI